MWKALFNFFLVLFAGSALAGGALKPLPSEKAFAFSSYVDDKQQIILKWQIAQGYYLYENKIHLAPERVLHVESAELHEGKYKNILILSFPTSQIEAKPYQWTVSYQGCSASGFCYPPVRKRIYVDLKSAKPFQSLIAEHPAVTSVSRPFISDQNFSEKIFLGHSLFFILLSFLGLGILLAFTPCVLPMVPILSGIIIGHHQTVSTWRGFSLSFFYVMGMAITYAIAGVLVAMLGSHVQILFQNPWVIFIFSVFFVLLSLSLFGVYELRLPQFMNHHTTKLSNRLTSGSYVGVFLMGCLSILIVSPCVTAPLVGVLAYISQTGNKLLGGSALFMLGFGMGVPLLLIGTSAGKWLPKAGEWMNLVKQCFGIVMLGVAIWMLSRILPGAIVLLLWGILFSGMGMYFILYHRFVSKIHFLLRALGGISIVYSLVLFVGSALGNTNPLVPWENISFAEKHTDFFLTVNNSDTFQKLIQEAKRRHQLVIIDFYAEWCTSCVAMDKGLFKQEAVKLALSDVMRLRIDVTRLTEFDQQMMERYQVIAPPTLLFFDKEGKQLNSERRVGEMTQTEFLNQLKQIKEL